MFDVMDSNSFFQLSFHKKNINELTLYYLQLKKKLNQQ